MTRINQAFASSSRRRSRRASAPRRGVIGDLQALHRASQVARTILPRKDDRSSAKILAVLISIEEVASGCSGPWARSAPARSRSPIPACGRVLAEGLTSAVDVPPFDSSAMDGFALEAGPARALG